MTRMNDLAGRSTRSRQRERVGGRWWLDWRVEIDIDGGGRNGTSMGLIRRSAWRNRQTSVGEGRLKGKRHTDTDTKITPSRYPNVRRENVSTDQPNDHGPSRIE